MQHLRSLEHVHLDSAWISIGSFDGVHRGHQALIKKLVAEAHRSGHLAVVVTFFPHPAVVLRDISEPYYLTTPEEQAVLLAALGVDYLVTLTFDRALAAVSANDFVQMLSTHLGLRQLWVGSDFALGRNREGNVPRLRQIGESLGFDVHIMEPVMEEGETISSSLVRAALKAGRVKEAARLLGRNYSVTGIVIHGDGRGHQLGIPTANLSVWSQRLLPAFGIYATWVWAGGQRLASVSNVGIRPMFEKNDVTPRIEAHLLDFDQDLYGQELTLEFVDYHRGEQKFSSIEAMLEQIKHDILWAREVFNNDP
jgi:riboflavin kinase / FMN adenylyltransferase